VPRRPESALADVSCPEVAKELEGVLQDAPDLLGVALMPAAPFLRQPPEPSVRQPSETEASKADCQLLLLRLDFLGHVSFERIHAHWAVAAPAMAAMAPQQQVRSQPIRRRLGSHASHCFSSCGQAAGMHASRGVLQGQRSSQAC
jgi:hypothetical protein